MSAKASPAWINALYEEGTKEEAIEWLIKLDAELSRVEEIGAKALVFIRALKQQLAAKDEMIEVLTDLLGLERTI